MSMEYHVYVNEVSDDIIPALVAELNKYEMTCEVHPGFFILHAIRVSPL